MCIYGLVIFVGTVDVIPLVERDLDVIATGVLKKAEEICKAKSVRRTFNSSLFGIISENFD